jgi:hypothetical protein
MDVKDTQASVVKGSKATPFHPNAAGDQKEVAWAFLGLVLWSAVVLGGLVGAGHVLGHFVFHRW